MGGFLSGRVTYELMAGFWPTADEDPASTEPMIEFARIWRDMPKIVYSTTLDHACTRCSSAAGRGSSSHQTPRWTSGSPDSGIASCVVYTPDQTVGPPPTAQLPVGHVLKAFSIATHPPISGEGD